jgi:hypothetical protein
MTHSEAGSVVSLTCVLTIGEWKRFPVGETEIAHVKSNSHNIQFGAINSSVTGQ